MSYIYSVKPVYPMEMQIAYDTDVQLADTLLHKEIGTPASYQTTCPAPEQPVEEYITYESIISGDDIDNMRELRKTKYHKAITGYRWTNTNLTQTEIDALIAFFVARKGRYENFNINYSYIFGGATTLVRFADDTLKISLDHYKRWSATVNVEEAVSGTYSARRLNAQRTLNLQYRKSDLSALKTFFSTTVTGRAITYTVDLSQLASYLTGSYTMRFNSDAFRIIRRSDNFYTVNVELIEVI